MRKFLYKSILFLSLLPIALIILIITWGSLAPNFINDNILFLLGSESFLYQRVREIPTHGKTDILVLGASHAYRGIDPRNFAEKNIKLFNLGSSSQTPIQTNMLLKQKLDYLNPNLVIYEVYPEVFCMDGVESSVDVISNDKITKSTLSMCYKVNDIRTYMTLIYSGYRQVFKLDEDKFIPDQILNDTYISGGFVEKVYAEYSEPKRTDSIDWSINKEQIEAFEESLQILKSQNVKVILIEAPITAYEKNRNVNYNKLGIYLSNLGLPYINFNKQKAYPNHLFYDSNHLNIKGVIKFNDELIDALINRKLIRN